jgi:hypothetical protein
VPIIQLGRPAAHSRPPLLHKSSDKIGSGGQLENRSRPIT